MAEINPNTRLEAFCDGVFAIAITLLIIEIKVPSHERVTNTTEFWLALKQLVPSVLAFVLSFFIILITWVNHHNGLKLAKKSSTTFIYANGFLLLTVAFLPFPTALLGEYIFTDHAAPAVILYNATLALQSVGWILMSKTAIRDRLAKNEQAIRATRKNGQFGFFAFGLYTVFAIIAIWFPLTIAIVTLISWIFWLILGIRLRPEEISS